MPDTPDKPLDAEQGIVEIKYKIKEFLDNNVKDLASYKIKLAAELLRNAEKLELVVKGHH